MHHAKRERWERYQAGEQSWWIVEDMGRGAAQGRSAGKRAWVTALRAADADPQAHEVGRAEVLRDRAQPVVAREAAAEAHL